MVGSGVLAHICGAAILAPALCGMARGSFVCGESGSPWTCTVAPSSRGTSVPAVAAFARVTPGDMGVIVAPASSSTAWIFIDLCAAT